MKDSRSTQNTRIRLGRIKKGSSWMPRIGTDSLRILQSLSPRSQRVVVKAKQSYSKGRGSWRTHGRYLEREKARTGDGFSKTEDSVRIAVTLDRWQKEGDEKLHKIILSPEHSDRLDLRVHTRDVMNEMERELGRSLEWVAIVHKNTDNHHAHVSLRGVDGSGKSLDVEQYLGESLRMRSRELVTRKLGPRLYPEIIKRREGELFARRITEIDRLLLWKADGDSIVTIPERLSLSWRTNVSREQERIRIAFLTGLGLAQRISNDSWSLSKEMRKTLKQLALQEQIIKEQVPGWEFVRSLRNSGVVRKQLQLGESLTARVIAVGIRDPFGDRKFMLLEGTDGMVYHMNEPQAVAQGKVKPGEVVTLTRRLASIARDKRPISEQIEFSAVTIHSDWQKSIVLDLDAAATLRDSLQTTRDSKRAGFALEWQRAVSARVAVLQGKAFNAHNRNWKTQLEAIRFAEIDPRARRWDAPTQVSNELPSPVDQPRLLLGEVRSVNPARMLVTDVRSNHSYIVSLKEVGLAWPPNVGAFVRLEVKPLPHFELRPSDERLASILAVHRFVKDEMLSSDERKFVRSRIRTWERWEFLKEIAPGRYELTGGVSAGGRQEILARMETKMKEMQAKLSEKARRQPAWLKMLDEKTLRGSGPEFGQLDRLLRDAGPLPASAPSNWLTKMLHEREALWEKRGIGVDRHFEKRAKAWLIANPSRDLFEATIMDSGKERTREHGRGR